MRSPRRDGTDEVSMTRFGPRSCYIYFLSLMFNSGVFAVRSLTALKCERGIAASNSPNAYKCKAPYKGKGSPGRVRS
ncbi:hypothetical protein F2P81_005577 [Scophthalmus maximus]|uniref:Uncharacterized protein n=1 Tax=Scophthalmus maximus TaxID=52904 RepID=A0A6A4TA16_SCOMX|nr:hypothetical protein F2P81_005577 [Scophthalmus maximus]